MTLLATIPTPFLLQELQRRGSMTADDHDETPDGAPAAMAPVVLAATRLVADAFRVPAEMLLGRSRLAHIAKARFALWLVLRDQGLTKRQIARAFRRRDSGTIRHGCIRARWLVRNDKTFARALRDAMAKIDPLLAKGAGRMAAMPA